MRVLAVKNIEEQGNLWAVRYTYLTAAGGNRGGIFLCETQEEAKAKYDELLDIVQHHAGVYLGKKAKKQLKTRRRNPGS